MHPRRVASECRTALRQTSAPPLSGWPLPSAGPADPFAPPTLPGFLATTGPSAPSPRFGTRLLMGPPLGGLPWHRGERFPRSAQEPAPGSRRLYAGHRSGSRQAPPELHPRPTTGAWFRRHLYAFDTSSAVHFRSSSRRAPDGFIPPFPDTLTTPAIGPEQLPVAWTPVLQPESEGPVLISHAASCFNSAATSRPPLRAVVAHSYSRCRSAVDVSRTRRSEVPRCQFAASWDQRSGIFRRIM